MKDRLNKVAQSEEWLRDIFDHAHDLIQIVNVDGTLRYVNKSWSVLLGYQQREIIGRSIFDFIEEADHLRYFDYRKQVLTGAIRGVPLIFNLIAKSDKRVAVEGIVSVKTEQGRPIYTRGIFRDISDRILQEHRLKQLNEELIEREQNLQQLLQNAPDAVIGIDRQSHIQFWNSKAEEIFGWTMNEVVNHTLSSTIIPEKYRQAHEEGMRRFLSTGEVRVLNKTIEISALNKKGEEFFVSLTISQTFQKSAIAFIAFIRDITEQKKYQLEIENKTRQLEQSNESLQAFAYAASHDLKQPIRKVQLFSERLFKKLYHHLDEVDRSYFERIEKSGRRMSGLIDDILMYSSVGIDNTFSSEVSLDDIVNEVLEDFEVDIQEHGIKIIHSSLPVIEGDRRQLQQLFHNLIGNSIKYRKPSVEAVIQVESALVNGSYVTVEFKGVDSNKSYHLIRIRDNGIGFAQIDAEKIFDVFTRLHNAMEYQGSGVGLSIACKVVDNHRGFIKAESELGEGATFKILFPAIQ